MEDSNVVFNFDDQVEKDTFHHLIALGEKANRVLEDLKLDLGNWFAEDLLTIEKGYEKVKYLLVLADDNVDISNLPKEYSDEKCLAKTYLSSILAQSQPQINGKVSSRTYGSLKNISTPR